MAGPPLAVVLSLIGLLMDYHKGFAIAGLVVGGLGCMLWLIPVLC